MVDTGDLKSPDQLGCAGSTPARRTIFFSFFSTFKISLRIFTRSSQILCFEISRVRRERAEDSHPPHSIPRIRNAEFGAVLAHRCEFWAEKFRTVRSPNFTRKIAKLPIIIVHSFIFKFSINRSKIYLTNL